jgi:hypothetical protein
LSYFAVSGEPEKEGYVDVDSFGDETSNALEPLLGGWHLDEDIGPVQFLSQTLGFGNGPFHVMGQVGIDCQADKTRFPPGLVVEGTEEV